MNSEGIRFYPLLSRPQFKLVGYDEIGKTRKTHLTISVSCSSSRRCRMRTDSIILRSSSVKWERSGMGEATTWARLGAAAAGDDDKTPDTDALIAGLAVDGWWTATEEDEAPTTAPPALNNELPPKAAMKASKLNRGRSFVCESNGIDDAASQGLPGQLADTHTQPPVWRR